MAGAAQGADDDAILGINVTPFVDIALVLLIIFMVTAKYIASLAIPVDLPQAATAQQNNSGATASVSVDRAGGFYLDGRPVTESELVARMRERHAQDADLRAIISADTQTPHGRVTTAIDLIRQGGVAKFAIRTDPTDPVRP